MFRKSWLVVLLVLAVTFAGFSMVGAQTLTVAQGADPVTLDPHGQNDQPSARVRAQIFETLVNHGYSLEIVPGLAKSWEQIDEVTWEFKLQENVKFHNGDDFTAADVKYSFERIKELPSPAAFLIDEVKEVVVIDDYTVQIVLKQPFAPILAHLAHPSNAIVNKRSVEEAGDNFGSQVAIGTGPFEFVEWVAGSHVELRRNENYWGEPAKVEKVIIRGIPENTVRAIELETGGVDIAYNIDPVDEFRLTGAPGIKLDKYETLSTSYIGFNVQKEPFDNPLVRKAINHALDVQAIADFIYTGQASPVTGPLPPLVWGSKTDLPEYEYNPEKAKALLAEAGYPNGLSLKMRSNSESEITSLIQEQLRQGGINVVMELAEMPVHFEGLARGDFDMYVSSQQFGYYTETVRTLDGIKYDYRDVMGGSGYKNEEFSAIAARAYAAVDMDERRDAYAELQQHVRENYASIGLYTNVGLLVSRSDLEGFELFGVGVVDMSNLTSLKQ